MNETHPNPETLPLVRAQVKDILTRSPSFRSLPEEKRRDLARDMVKVAHFIVGDDRASTPLSATLAGRPAQTTRGRPGQQQPPPDPAGKTSSGRLGESGATAAREGTDAYTTQIKEVDFPGFVGGLVHGVFDAIVTSSIKQMEAYAELVKNVAKSVDEYMKDNVSPNQARDYLAERYPSHLEVDISGRQPTLKPREGADDESLPDFFKDLGLDAPVSSLDEDVVEQKLVPAARRRMAMDRQQLLATMVLMGINRLIVTDGKIQASVLFELDTKDAVKRKYALTTDHDTTHHYGSESGYEGSREAEGREGGFLWWGGKDVKENNSWYGKNFSDTMANFKVSTVNKEDSESSVKLHTTLSGKVDINFRSETFPLERMADVLQINQIRDKVPGQLTTPTTTPAATAAPAQAPAMLPVPPLPPAGK